MGAVMGHKASKEFFISKREWSKRKDEILGYYLTPYLPKIATQRRPILLVDGFAGPGEFEDGERGSPLIIALAIREAKQKGIQASIQALLIEKDAGLADRLKQRMVGFSYCEVRSGPFDDFVPEVLEKAASSSTFLYLDPFTVEGLRWESLDSMFVLLERGLSIEILLNFNVDNFCRRALSALKAAPPPVSDELPEADPDIGPPSSVQSVSEIVGGDWWINVLTPQRPYETKVQQVTAKFCEQLASRFDEVCFYPVKEKWHHKVPKYVLVFGSRHPDALWLMNDAMCRAREKFLRADPEDGSTLFELRPETLVPAPGSLENLVLEGASAGRIARRSLVCDVIRRAFCLHSTSEIIAEIRTQLKAGTLASATGKARIGDEIEVWRP